MTARQIFATERFDCPRCGRKAGDQCRNVSRTYRRGRALAAPHPERVHEARKAGY